MLAIRQTMVAVRGGDTMNDVKRSVQAISAFIFLSKYCETEKCEKCVFDTGGVGTKREYGCGLVAALSDHRRFSTVLERAINREKELEGGIMTELKPCPFCGGEAEIFVSDVTDRALVYCRGCDAQIQMKPNEEEAIEAWNKRVGEVAE